MTYDLILQFGMKMKNKIWTPYKIWNETLWFNNFEKMIEKIWEEKTNT